jgi:signal transduction histidine kinase
LPAWFVAVELAVGFVLLAGEGAVFEEGHAFAGRQSLAGGWPVIGVIGAGVTLGPWLAAAAGAVVGTGRLAGALVNGVRDFDGDRVASLAATVAFYALYGAVAGWVGRLLRRAEAEVAVTRAREEVAMTLHDGVLQTLALVERRVAGTDPTLARLARDTDRELRAFLFDQRRPAADRRTLSTALHDVAVKAAKPYDLDVTVSVVGDDVTLHEAALHAVTGAVGEAVTNVGKHAGARHAVVFAERGDDGTLFVSVRDDGAGFDADHVHRHGEGLARSIVGRLTAAGGRAEIVSRPGEGTEVRLWLP